MTDQFVYIPLEIFLKNTFARNAKFFADSIKAGFCGHCLIPAIEQFGIVFINNGDQISVQVNSRRLVIFAVVYRGVSRCPVPLAFDSGDHLLLNFSHDGGVATDLMVGDKWGAGAPR